MNYYKYIAIDDKILCGKPVIKGTRIAVEFIVELLSKGWTLKEITANYPGITSVHINACLAYASAIIHSQRVYLLPRPHASIGK